MFCLLFPNNFNFINSDLPWDIQTQVKSTHLIIDQSEETLMNLMWDIALCLNSYHDTTISVCAHFKFS